MSCHVQDPVRPPGPGRRPRSRRTAPGWSRRGRRRRRSCRAPPSAVAVGSKPRAARSGTFAMALLPGEPWSTRTMFCVPSGSSAAWSAVTSPAARMRGLSRPGTSEYAVVGGVHFGGIWPAQSVASVAIVHGVVPSTQRGALSRTAPKRPPSNFASMRSSVSELRNAPPGRAAAALEQHETAQLGVAGVGRADAGQVEVGGGVARGEARAGRVAAEEDVLVARRGARRGDDRVDVAREDQVRPVRDERHVGLRVVEHGAAVRSRRQDGIERQRQLAAVEPVEARSPGSGTPRRCRARRVSSSWFVRRSKAHTSSTMPGVLARA